MKKGDKPKDLSQSWWSKNKAKTMKSSGLGAALGAYEKQRIKPKSLAYYEACLKELGKLPAAVDKAKKLCDKKLHAETLEALGGYAAVISKEMNELAKEETDYTNRLSIFKSSRVALVKEIQQMNTDISKDETALTDAFKKLKEAVKKKDAKNANAIATQLRKDCTELVKDVNKAIDKCAPWRTGQPPYNQGALDAGDRDKAGGAKTLETINPLMAQIGDSKKEAERIPGEIDKELQKLG